MIEQLLGTALLCCIITAFFYCLFYKIACKSNINDFEADSPYIGDYASSIIVFLAISSLTLLIVVYFYITISPKLPKFLNDSGFTFAFLQLGAGFFIRLLHKIFFFTIVKITKSTSYHKLTSSEISWTWLILCFIYGIVFLINKECTIAFTYFVIDFPWILLTCFVLKVLAFFKIQSLKEYLPMLICGYLYFLIIALTMLQVLCKYLDKLLCNYTFLTNDWVTEITYLYIIVFFSIVISKHIPTGLLKIVIHPFVNKNSTEYKRIFNQYHLLNYYFLVAITLVLKALNFTGEEKALIDALFYTTNALTLFSTARQKASISS